MITPTSGPFGLVVRFTVRAGSEREFDDLVATTVKAMPSLFSPAR
jgi:hypothetical protein